MADGEGGEGPAAAGIGDMIKLLIKDRQRREEEYGAVCHSCPPPPVYLRLTQVAIIKFAQLSPPPPPPPVYLRLTQVNKVSVCLSESLRSVPHTVLQQQTNYCEQTVASFPARTPPVYLIPAVERPGNKAACYT